MNLLYYKHFLLAITMSFALACGTAENKVSQETHLINKEDIAKELMDSSIADKQALSSKDNKKKTKIMVVQCANGYEYGMHNYEFNPKLEKELGQLEFVELIPFPLKTLMGVTYQGVFDKKYCKDILDRVKVDFLILTRFDKNFEHLKQDRNDWGYELKIVNAHTLEQTKSISAQGLKTYPQIEEHISKNIDQLIADLERIR